jgi:hypothetical protein
MRSEADRLGLAVRPAGVAVATAGGRPVTADVAVASSVEIGQVRLSEVVFLVFPDELLTFPDGHTIPGLIGFPVIEALGEVRFRRDQVIEVPLDPPRRSLGNLALEELDPLVRVRYLKDELVCRLDTGAGETAFYEPFYRRYKDRIEALGKPIRATSTGVGGAGSLAAYRLPRVAITLGAAGVSLEQVDVFTEPLAHGSGPGLACNVGLDALRRFPAYVINFRDMALVIETP